MNKIKMSTNEQIYKKEPNRILELKNIRTGLGKKKITMKFQQQT